MNELDKYLASVAEEADYSNFEKEENFARRKLPTSAKPKVIVQRDGTRKIVSMPTHPSIQEVYSSMQNSLGDINIFVRLNVEAGGLIGVPLPFVLFGLTDISNQFRTVLRGFIPSGVTYNGMVVNSNGDLQLSYSQGANVNIITIGLRTRNVNYAYFLNSMNQNYFKTNFIQQSVSFEPAATTQFSQLWNFGLLSSLGKQESNELIPNSRRMVWDFQKDRVPIFLPEQKVTPDFGLVSFIIPQDGFETYFDVFVSERFNLNKV